MTTYAEYLAKDKKKKINPVLIASKEAKVPTKFRAYYNNQPMLDMKSKVTLSKYSSSKQAVKRAD